METHKAVVTDTLGIEWGSSQLEDVAVAMYSNAAASLLWEPLPSTRIHTDT